MLSISSYNNTLKYGRHFGIVIAILPVNELDRDFAPKKPLCNISLKSILAPQPKLKRNMFFDIPK